MSSTLLSFPTTRRVAMATMAALANALSATLGEGVDKPDSAIVVVLKKLESGRCNLELDARDRTATEAAAHAIEQQVVADLRDRSHLLEEAWAYAARHPEDWEQRRAAIEAEHPDPPRGDARGAWVRSVRQGLLVGAVLALYHASAPDPAR